MTNISTRNDDVLNNLTCTRVYKIPRCRSLPHGDLGNVVYDLETNTFYGFQGLKWIPFNGSFSSTLSDGGPGNSFIVDNGPGAMVIKKLQSIDGSIVFTDTGSGIDLSAISALDTTLTSTGGASLVVSGTSPGLAIRGTTSTGLLSISNTPTTQNLSADWSAGSANITDITGGGDWIAGILPSNVLIQWHVIGLFAYCVAKAINVSGIITTTGVNTSAFFTFPVSPPLISGFFTSVSDVFGPVTATRPDPHSVVNRRIPRCSLQAVPGGQRVRVDCLNIPTPLISNNLDIDFISMNFAYFLIIDI